MKILTAEQMRNIDRRATERFGVPSIVLMENAAIAVVEAIARHYPDAERVAILCGTGKNGGDGLAVARHLENRGIVPVVLIAGDRSRYRDDALINLTICERLNIPLYEVREPAEEALAHAADVDLIVDAIFGTGLNRAPAGLEGEIIRAVTELRIPVLAVDLPSGLSASSPIPFEPAIRAETTVTFAAPKLCHVFDPAATWCGEVIVADISIPAVALDEENVTLSLTTQNDVAPYVAERGAATHKGTYGHVGIIGGSSGRVGAAVLAARGALRSGAGLVTVMTDVDTASMVHTASVESMTWSGELAPFLERKDAIVAGPGLADDDPAYKVTRQQIATIELPLVIDASALNAFAGAIESINPNGRPVVITPHPGELARLTGSTTAEIANDRIGAVRDAAARSRCVVVLKGHQTLIADPEGRVNVNPTGNPGMATGGMGDVLAGMVGAYLARGLDPFDAAITATYLHGRAADLLEEEMGDAGLTATDVADRIPQAMRSLRE